jgi:parallel beta-helix repeat protein
MSNLTSPEISDVSETMLERYINTGTLVGGATGKITFYGTDDDREVWIGTRFIDSCQDLTEEGGYYTLNQSIETSAATCFNTTNNSITLDLNNYNITGNISSTIYAVYSNGSKNVTIKNGGIYNINTTAIYAENGDSLTIKNVRIHNSGKGIFLLNSSSNRLEDLIIYNSTETSAQNGALTFKNSKNNTVENFNFTLGARNLLRFVADSGGSSSNNTLINGNIGFWLL